MASKRSRRQRPGRPARGETSPSGAAALPLSPAAAGRKLALGTLGWLIPAFLLWMLLTAPYNRFLVVAGENLLQLAESPDITRLYLQDTHGTLIARADFPRESEVVGSFRVTDLHFHLVLLFALFLGTPGIPWRRRFETLGWALLVTVFFHLFLVVSWVQFTYTTQLGSWSLEHYGPVARNLWGLTKHVLDLPVKLAWPFALWAFFHLGTLLPAPRPEPEGP